MIIATESKPAKPRWQANNLTLLVGERREGFHPKLKSNYFTSATNKIAKSLAREMKLFLTCDYRLTKPAMDLRRERWVGGISPSGHGLPPKILQILI